MFKDTKIGSRLEVRESEKGKLKISRAYQAPQASIFSDERAASQENSCQVSQRDFRTIMLEAEQKKAKALMEFQNRRRFY